MIIIIIYNNNNTPCLIDHGILDKDIIGDKKVPTVSLLRTITISTSASFLDLFGNNLCFTIEIKYCILIKDSDHFYLSIIPGFIW